MLLKPQVMVSQCWFLLPCYKTLLSQWWCHKYSWGLLSEAKNNLFFFLKKKDIFYPDPFFDPSHIALQA